MADKNYLKFNDESQAGKDLLEWWRGLDKNRGDRAELRRAGEISEVVFISAYHRLRYDLLKYSKVYENGLAATVGILAHVKQNDPLKTFAQQMAQSKDGSDKARLSDLRFRRLLKCQSHEDLYIDMIRVVRQLDGRANALSLANMIYWWNDRTKQTMAREYYTLAMSED